MRVEIAQAGAEYERRRLEFLAFVGLRMASSMDYAATLEDVARAAIPDLADLCAITVVAPDGRPQALVGAHADPEREQLVRELQAHGAATLPGAADAMRTGEHELLVEVTDELLAAAATDEEHLRRLRELGLRSSLTVPMKASGRVLGTITLGFSGSDRRFADVVVEYRPGGTGRPAHRERATVDRALGDRPHAPGQPASARPALDPRRRAGRALLARGRSEHRRR